MRLCNPNSRALELIVTAEEQGLSPMIAHMFQQRILDVGAHLFATRDALIEFGVNPFGVGHFSIIASPAGNKDPRSTDVVVPADNPLHGIPNHVDVNRSGLLVLGEVEEVHVAGEHGAVVKVNNIIDQVTLLGGLQDGNNAPLLGILFHIVIMDLSQLPHKLNQLHTSCLRNPIEKQHVNLGLGGIVQLIRTKLKDLQRSLVTPELIFDMGGGVESEFKQPSHPK